MKTLIIKEEWFDKDYIYYSPEKDTIQCLMANIGDFVSDYDGIKWFFIDEL